MTSPDRVPDVISADVLHRVVQCIPGQDVRGIITALAAYGYRHLSKSVINHHLYSREDLFCRNGTAGSRPLWYAIGSPFVTPSPADAESPLQPPASAPAAPHSNLSLYPWQERSIQAWHAHNYRGVIEAVTGAGKTRVVLAAASEQLAAHGKVVVVVPSIPLLHQWAKELETRVLRCFSGK